MARSQSATAFVVLLSTSIAGALHAPWYAGLAGACLLVLISLYSQRAASLPQWRGVSDPMLVLSSILNAAAAAAAVFIFGHLARWIWGL